MSAPSYEEIAEGDLYIGIGPARPGAEAVEKRLAQVTRYQRVANAPGNRARLYDRIIAHRSGLQEFASSVRVELVQWGISHAQRLFGIVCSSVDCAGQLRRGRREPARPNQ